MSTIERKIPESRIKDLLDSWDEVEEAKAKIEEAQVAYNVKVVEHNAKRRAALKEQGAPVNHAINMDTGIIFDPTKVVAPQPR